MGDRTKQAAPDGAVKSFGVGFFYKRFTKYEAKNNSAFETFRRCSI